MGFKLQTPGNVMKTLPPISRLTANMLRCCCYSLGENIREDMTAKSLKYRIREVDNKSHFVQFLFCDESLIATVRILDSTKIFSIDIGKGEPESNHPKITMRELLNLVDICYRAASMLLQVLLEVLNSSLKKGRALRYLRLIFQFWK